MNTNHQAYVSHQVEAQCNIILSNHAQVRMKQRCIKASWINLVLEYGREVYQKGKHSYSISLDSTGVKKIKRLYGDMFDVSKLRSLYLIVSEDNVLVTCAYR